MLEALDSVFNFFRRSGTTFPTFHRGVFVGFKKFVGLEEVSDFVQQMLGQVFNVFVLGKAWVVRADA